MPLTEQHAHAVPPRRRLRLLRRGLGYLLAGVLVLLALGNGIGSQLLPLAEQHPQRIADWLGVRAKAPVAFDHVDTEWTRRGPLLRLDNLRIGDPANPLRIGDAEILVAQYAGLLPGRSFTELRVRGLDLALQRDAQGRWSVRGLPGQQQQGGSDPFALLERLGELQVSHARLHVLAPELGLDVRLPRIDLRMQVNGKRITGGATAWLKADATPFDMALRLDRGKGDGRLYAGTRQADLSQLAGTFDVAGISPVSGSGRAQAWARLQGNRVVALHLNTDLQDIVLQGAAGADAKPPIQVLGDVDMAATWTGALQDWRVRVPRLRIGEGSATQVLDGLALDVGRRIAVRAPRVQTDALLGLVSLSDAAAPGLRHWLGDAGAGALVRDLRVDGVRGGALQVRARIDDARFESVGNAPGMDGVSGWLQGDQHGLRLRFDPAAKVAFDWPVGFGVVHAFNLDGEAVLWRDGDGWSVQTPGLDIDRGDLRVRARGGIGFTNDGTRPRLDLAVDIDGATVAMAPGFWVHHLMPKSTVDWLNSALKGGTLHEVHAVVAGDLDDWPFRNEPGMAGAGVFRVQAHLRNGLVKFQPDWPAAEQVDTDIAFVADGFSVDGKAVIAGVPVERLRGGIQRFGRSELQIDADAAGDAKNLLALLAASPLHKQYGEVMDNLRVSGPAKANLHLLLPFHHDKPPARQVRGTVQLAGVKVSEERWKLAFEDVRGDARYDEGGFLAEALQVRHEDTPGQLALRAGPHAKDPSQAFEAELRVQADIDGLLDKAGNLDWLKPHMQGTSTWAVEVGVPRGADDPATATRLRLRSSLAGTRIDLPAPLDKPAGQTLPARVELRLPIERGQVDVTLGDLLSLRSRSSGDQTGIRIQMGGERADAPPAHGLLIGGEVDQLDALDWIGVIAGDRGGNAGPPLHRVDVQARRLRLLGADFANTRLAVAPAPRGIAVQVQGQSLTGALLVPSQDGAAVAGRFERLHWMPRKEAAAGTGALVPATPAVAPSSDFNPAAIPPLLFDVGDLRIGKTALGAAHFRSVPAAAGMRLEEFRTSGGKQRLNANGVWTGRGASARTQLKLHINSDDIGTLLGGLGLEGQVDAGKGTLGMTASWNGAPDAFSLATLQADIALDARDGRLLEIEPGAGRVLGLLGIAQLPRRLTLDFRDFFEKGFAFDRIHGDVRVAAGSARTSDLSIEGPAADIRVGGSADLRAQRFDQTVEVLPKSGGLLTAVGAIAAGPVGAAVGAVANAVLDKPLQGIGSRTYRVTGPWKSPKVETIDRARAPTTQPAVEPPG